MQEKNEFSIISAGLAWVMGLYIAEGHCDKRKKINRVTFYLGEKEKDICQKLDKILYNEFAIKSEKPYIRFGSISKSFSSKKLKELVKIFGNLASEKTLPLKVIKGMNKKVLLNLLKGYLDGDGCYFKNKQITATTVSENLSYQLRLAFSKINILLYIRKCKKRISKIGTRTIFYRHFPFDLRVASTLNSKKLFPGKFKKNYPRRDILETEKFFAVPIRSKKEINFQGRIFNIEVENTHEYLVHGFAVDNCTWSAYNEQAERLVINENDPMCKFFT